MHRAGLGELHEFEQRAACFDGDPVIATKKGLNVLERGGQVARHGEMQELLDFPRGEGRIERHAGAEEPTFQLHASRRAFHRAHPRACAGR